MKKVLLFALILGVGSACASKSQSPALPTGTIQAQSTPPTPKLSPRAISAQVFLAVDTVQANKPFTLAWDHDGQDVDDFLIEFRDAMASNQIISSAVVPFSALGPIDPATGLGSATYVVAAGLKRGQYNILAYARNSSFSSDPSAPLNVTATPGKPKTPTGLRIISK